MTVLSAIEDVLFVFYGWNLVGKLNVQFKSQIKVSLLDGTGNLLGHALITNVEHPVRNPGISILTMTPLGDIEKIRNTKSVITCSKFGK